MIDRRPSSREYERQQVLYLLQLRDDEAPFLRAEMKRLSHQGTRELRYFLARALDRAANGQSWPLGKWASTLFVGRVLRQLEKPEESS